MVIRVTNSIMGSEKAYALSETHEQSPGSKGFHRYQIIRVNRDGELAEWRRDMGLAKNFKGVNPIMIPSLWEHTVDELIDMADGLRGQVKFDFADRFNLHKYKLA